MSDDGMRIDGDLISAIAEHASYHRNQDGLPSHGLRECAELIGEITRHDVAVAARAQAEGYAHGLTKAYNLMLFYAKEIEFSAKLISAKGDADAALAVDKAQA